MEKTLDMCKEKEKGIVKHIHGTGPLRKRLFDMGLTLGCEITVIKTAPFRDPMEIYIRGYFLIIRKETARLIVLKT